MTGTPAQLDWALQIIPRVAAEFDRVAAAFREVAARQPDAVQSETNAILAILAEKRAEELAHPVAGYYIKNWRESGGRVRALLASDPRFQAIQATRAARLNAPPAPPKYR